jgi:hypothetical protein
VNFCMPLIMKKCPCVLLETSVQILNVILNIEKLKAVPYVLTTSWASVFLVAGARTFT